MLAGMRQSRGLAIIVLRVSEREREMHLSFSLPLSCSRKNFPFIENCGTRLISERKLISMTQKVIQLTLDNCCSWGVSMPKSGMLFSVIFISSAISALTPEMHDMEAISGAAATGDNTTQTEVPNNDQFILSKDIYSTGTLLGLV